MSHSLLAPSLCISYSTKSDNTWNHYESICWVGILLYDEILGKKSFSPPIIPKTKGLKENLVSLSETWLKIDLCATFNSYNHIRA